MKGLYLIVISILSLFEPLLGNCQNWPQIYFPNTGTFPWGVIESYDHGFVTGGMYYSSFTYHWGYVLKTDINGEILWHKKIGTYDVGTIVYDIKQTDEGG